MVFGPRDAGIFFNRIIDFSLNCFMYHLILTVLVWSEHISNSLIPQRQMCSVVILTYLATSGGTLSCLHRYGWQRPSLTRKRCIVDVFPIFPTLNRLVWVAYNMQTEYARMAFTLIVKPIIKIIETTRNNSNREFYPRTDKLFLFWQNIIIYWCVYILALLHIYNIKAGTVTISLPRRLHGHYLLLHPCRLNFLVSIFEWHLCAKWIH